MSPVHTTWTLGAPICDAVITGSKAVSLDLDLGAGLQEPQGLRGCGDQGGVSVG